MIPILARSFCTYSQTRMQLAKRLVGNTSAPKKALTALFDKQIQKQKDWNCVSNEMLNILNLHISSRFCKYVLSEFQDDEVQKMLKLHTEMGFIYAPSLRRVYLKKHAKIYESVDDCAKTLMLLEGDVYNTIDHSFDDGK